MKIPTSLRESDHLIEILESVGEVGLDDCAFAVDTVAMYLNVDREEAITAFTTSYKTNQVEYNLNLLIKLLARVLQFSMQNNIFRVIDMYHRQKNRVAVGMPPVLDLETKLIPFIK